MSPRLWSGAAAIGVLTISLLSAGGSLAAPSAAATPPPTPPPLPPPSATAEPAETPIPMPSGFGMPGTGSPAPIPSASPTPPPDARKGLEGVWEMQIQHGAQTNYAHFKLAQAGTSLSGLFLNESGKRFPLAGSVDGQTVRLVVSMSDGTTLVLQGRLDGTTDMIGLLTTPQEQVPFTAAYRPKEKWIENLNASPGGLGGPGGGGGGIGPP